MQRNGWIGLAVSAAIIIGLWSLASSWSDQDIAERTGAALALVALALTGGLAVRGVRPGGSAVAERRRLNIDTAASPLEDAARIDAILEHLPVGIGLADRSGRFIVTNHEMRRYVGGAMPSRAPDARHRWRGFRPDGRQIEPDEFPGARGLRGETTIPGIEFLHTRENGEQLWTQIACEPMRGDDGEIVGAVLVIHDIDQLKRAEADLAARHEELQAVYDTAPVGMCMLDRDMRFIRINRRLAAMNRRPPEAHIGRRVGEVVPEIREVAELLFRRVIETREPILNHEVTGVRATEAGDLQSWTENWVPILDPRGEVVGVNVVVEETTERRLMTMALAQSEAQLKLATEGAEVGTWDMNLRTGSGRWSPEGVRQLGAHDPTFSMQEWLEAVHRDDREDVWSAWTRAVAAGEPFEVRFRAAQSRPGGERWILSRGRVELDPDGEPVRAAGVMIDISVQARAEAALAESERRLSAVLDNTDMAVILLNHRQQCVYMNPAAERLTGYRFVEVDGQPMHAVIRTQGLAEEADAGSNGDGGGEDVNACPISRAFLANTQEHGEEIFVHRDGYPYPVAFTASPIRDHVGQAVGTVVELRDIRAERAQQEHRKMLIDELNHRVKNTLATVQSIAAQSLKGRRAAAEAREAIESRLIALSRSHDLLTRKSWEGASLRDVALAAVEPFGPVDGELRRFTIEGEPIWLRPKHALSIGMALHELATNALKYGALSVPEGHVELSWRIDEERGEERLCLRWAESGGPPVSPPAHKGFGSRLIERGLSHELGGQVTLDFKPTGVVCDIEVTAPLQLGT
jgi:PAS domain S-box-containing protein